MGNHNKKDIIIGIAIGLIVGLLIVLTLILTGYLAVFDKVPMLIEIIKWIFINLRLSIVAFLIVLVFFFTYLVKLDNALKEEEPSIDQISHLNNMLNVFISLFFGIGVLWTAIGMRAALINSLGGLDQTTAASKGAWAILKSLVDGGLLTALSTTIVGGFGGYFMRIIKAVKVGHRLSRLARTHNSYSEQIYKTIVKIKDIVENLKTSCVSNTDLNVNKDV